MGVAIVADVFMEAIETVTSVKRTVKKNIDGKIRYACYRIAPSLYCGPQPTHRV